MKQLLILGNQHVQNKHNKSHTSAMDYICIVIITVQYNDLMKYPVLGLYWEDGEKY